LFLESLIDRPRAGRHRATEHVIVGGEAGRWRRRRRCAASGGGVEADHGQQRHHAYAGAAAPPAALLPLRALLRRGLRFPRCIPAYFPLLPCMHVEAELLVCFVSFIRHFNLCDRDLRGTVWVRSVLDTIRSMSLIRYHMLALSVRGKMVGRCYW
jgi:hypothetical protein